MRDSFQIVCCRTGAILRFYAPQRPRSGVGGFTHCRVSVTASSASADFELYDFAIERLGRFFAELAEHWKGWEGEQRWDSVEDHASLSATSDRTGHVILTFEVREHGHPRHSSIRVSGKIHLEAGALERLALAAQDFVSHG